MVVPPVYMVNWSLSASAVNAWRLRQAIRGEKEPYVDFMRELCIEMFEVHGSPPIRRYSVPVKDNNRYDGHNHLIVGIFDEGGNAHRKNCKQCYSTSKKRLKTVYQCKKCAVHCFKEVLILSTNSKYFWTKMLFYWLDFILDIIWCLQKIFRLKKFCHPSLNNALGCRESLFNLYSLHLCIYSFNLSFIPSFIYTFIYSFIHLYIHSCIHYCIHTIINALIHIMFYHSLIHFLQ